MITKTSVKNIESSKIEKVGWQLRQDHEDTPYLSIISVATPKKMTYNQQAN